MGWYYDFIENEKNFLKVLTLLLDVEDSLTTLCQLKNLHHLDISQCNESRGHFKHPTQFLQTLVTRLGKLQSLDISGQAQLYFKILDENVLLVTNLAGTGDERLVSEGVQCDIVGLAGR